MLFDQLKCALAGSTSEYMYAYVHSWRVSSEIPSWHWALLKSSSLELRSLLSRRALPVASSYVASPSVPLVYIPSVVLCAGNIITEADYAGWQAGSDATAGQTLQVPSVRVRRSCLKIDPCRKTQRNESSARTIDRRVVFSSAGQLSRPA